jgi:hypothetical protein
MRILLADLKFISKLNKLIFHSLDPESFVSFRVYLEISEFFIKKDEVIIL